VRPIHLRASSRLSGCCCVRCQRTTSLDMPRSIPRWNGVSKRVWLIRFCWICSSDMGPRREWAYTKIPFLFHRRDGFRYGFVRPVRARLRAQCCRYSRDGNKRAAPVFASVKPRSKSTGALELSFHQIEHEPVTSDAGVYARGGPRRHPLSRHAARYVCCLIDFTVSQHRAPDKRPCRCVRLPDQADSKHGKGIDDRS
jgi:hypothetical protein